MSIKRISIAAFLVLVLAVGMTFVPSETINTGNHAHGVNVALAATSVSSVKSGTWSSPTTWSGRQVPASGDSVIISQGHTVTYDVLSDTVLAGVTIKGTLSFSRTANTRLKLNDNLMVLSGGFLDMGTTGNPIPANVKTEAIFVLPQGKSFVGGSVSNIMQISPGDTGLMVMGGGRGKPTARLWYALGANWRQMPSLAATPLS